MFRKSALAFAACASLASPAHAEGTAGDFLDAIDKKVEAALYNLDGMAKGLFWANVELNDKGGKMLFCAPPKLAITAEQTAQILRNHVENHPTTRDFPVGLVLLKAYEETFPC